MPASIRSAPLKTQKKKGQDSADLKPCLARQKSEDGSMSTTHFNPKNIQIYVNVRARKINGAWRDKHIKWCEFKPLTHSALKCAQN